MDPMGTHPSTCIAGTRVLRLVASHLVDIADGTQPVQAVHASSSVQEVARQVKLTKDELRFYNAHGFLYVPGVVEPNACDVLRDEVLEVCALDPKINLTHEQLLDGSARDGDMLRQSAMHTKEQLLYSLRNSPNLIDIASQLVDGEAMLYNGFTAVKGAGGGGLFDLHQDNMYTRHDNGDRTAPRTEDYNNDGWGSCGIWVALHDLLEPENGSLIVAVDSHLNGTLPSKDYSSDRGVDKQLEENSPVRSSQVLPIRMRRGDICVFNRATVHGSLPNSSDQVRIGYGLQYSRVDVNWLDRSTGNEFDGQWRPLAAGDSPFQSSVMPVERLGPQKQT